MKKNLLILFLSCISFLAVNATIHQVSVQNFQFTPATFNAVVGDTVKWTWIDGSHTTTSDNIPTGAASWNNPMNSNNTSFQYKITVAGTYSYHCIPHQAFGMVATFTVATMPVTLVNFGVTSTAGNNNALISWSTATEQNTDHFSVKRSVDGIQFAEIAQVKAAGNSSTIKNYSYTDANIGTANKYLYYTLETVDRDGSKQLSDIKMFRNNLAAAKLITKLSPNPISSPGHLMLQFNADKEGSMLCRLYDANGKLVKETEMMAVSGLNNGHFHLGDLPAGTYTIVFTLDGIKEVKSIVVQ